MITHYVVEGEKKTGDVLQHSQGRHTQSDHRQVTSSELACADAAQPAVRTTRAGSAGKIPKRNVKQKIQKTPQNVPEICAVLFSCLHRPFFSVLRSRSQTQFQTQFQTRFQTPRFKRVCRRGNADKVRLKSGPIENEISQECCVLEAARRTLIVLNRFVWSVRPPLCPSPCSPFTVFVQSQDVVRVVSNWRP